MRTALPKALRSGVAAMAGPEIEARVVDFFFKNPNYSRDVEHVAAGSTSLFLGGPNRSTPQAFTRARQAVRASYTIEVASRENSQSTTS